LIIDTLADIDPAQWQALAGDNPTLSYTFLHALHEMRGAAHRLVAALPDPAARRRAARGHAAVPEKHSRGEYVFDQGWADAFHRHGMPYYPKLLSAVPFTPVTGRPAAGAHGRGPRAAGASRAASGAAIGASSLHILFPDDEDRQALAEAGYMLREGVQFHWENQDYADFDAFLASMKMEKRKKLRQDRKRVQDAGIAFEHLAARSATTCCASSTSATFRPTRRTTRGPTCRWPFPAPAGRHAGQPDDGAGQARRDAGGGGAEPGRRQRHVRPLLGHAGIRLRPAL
jgi:predicted N-acyltransferase